MDYRTAEARSALMSRIRSKNTRPELLVRSLVHRMGYRFRLHYPGLPGKPDLAFPSAKKAVFVHGCFWHAHGCRTGKPPKSRLEFWGPKLDSNKVRDQRDQEGLATRGWRVLVVWQCEARDQAALATKIERFLGGGRTMHQALRKKATRAPRRHAAVSPA